MMRRSSDVIPTGLCRGRRELARNKLRKESIAQLREGSRLMDAHENPLHRRVDQSCECLSDSLRRKGNRVARHSGQLVRGILVPIEPAFA